MATTPRGDNPSDAQQEPDTTEDTLSIGELGALSGVSTRTIRYYEELGILPHPNRTEGGTRRYARDYVFYVEGALLLKQMGFGLEEIAELGDFALRGNEASERTREILHEKLHELEHRIRVLSRLQAIVRTAASGKAMPDGSAPDLLRWVGEMRFNEAAEPRGRAQT